MAISIRAAKVKDRDTVEDSGGDVTHGRQLDTTNTGPQAAGYTLTAFTGSRNITTNGTILEGYLFDALTGPLNIFADNVIIRGCEFRTTDPNFYVVRYDNANLLVEDCRFRPRSSGPETTMAQSYQQAIKCFGTARGLTVKRTEFWGFGNAIEFESATASLSQPILVEECWMHHAAAINYVGADEYHHDGLLCSSSAGYVTVRRCKIHSEGNTNALAFQSTGGAWHDCSITDSSFSGFGYTLNFGDSAGATRFVFTGNDINTEFEPVYNGGPPNPLTSLTWNDNHWRYFPGSYGSAAWDGKYWWPNDGNTSGGHTVDY